METYVILSTFEGSASDIDFDKAEEMQQQYEEMLNAFGVKLVGSWITLGRFDSVAVVEAPNAMAVRGLVAASPAGMQTETLRAFPGTAMDWEFVEMMRKVLKP